MSKSKERLFELDRQAVREMVLGAIENRDTKDITARTVPFGLSFNPRGKPEMDYGRETELKEAEYQGMRSMWQLAQRGYKKVFWLSPPGGRSGYGEGRLVVARLVGNDKTGVKFDCRGVILLASPEEILVKARRLEEQGEGMGRIEVAEDLREIAIGVDIGEEGLWDYCERIFGMSRVWEVIRNGDDLAMKEEITKVGVAAKAEVKARLGRIDASNSLVATAMWEGIMARNGYRVVGGNHGGTSLSMMKGGIYNSIFGKRTQVDAKGKIESYCEPCHRWYKGDNCPYCN